MPNNFPYLSEYRQLVEGAHKKAALPLGTPALVYHMAFWKPRAQADLMAAPEQPSSLEFDEKKEKSLSEEQRERRENEIDEYLGDVYEKLRFGQNNHITNFESDSEVCFRKNKAEVWLTLFRKTLDITSFFDPSSLLERRKAFRPITGKNLASAKYVTDAQIDYRQFERSSQHQTLNFGFCWHGLATRIRFELSTEYYTTTVFIDLSKSLNASILSGQAPNVVLEKTQRAFCNLYKTISLEESVKAGLAQSVHEIRKYNVEAFRRLHTRNGSHHFLYFDIWERFRKEILLVDGIGNPSAAETPKYGRLFADFRGLLVNSNDKTSTPFELPFHDRPHAPRIEEPEDVPKSWAGERIKMFWSFLTCGDEVALKKYEFTASRFLRGKVVYVSALGAQPQEPAGAKHPILYFMNMWTTKKWPIGRLIDSIHQLGTVRLAAIIELDRLHKSGGWLRDIEKLIERTRQFVQAEAKGMGSKDESVRTTAIENTVNTVAKNISDMEGGLSKIYEVGKDRNLGHQSFAYRLERAEYYVRQFTNGVRRLGPKQIEGFQPYDQFVFRRLGSAFAYVSMLNSRSQRVAQEIRSFVEYLSAQSSVLQGRRLADREERLVEIQRVGEWALFFGLLPYYIGSIVQHLFDGWLSSTAPGGTSTQLGISSPRFRLEVHTGAAESSNLKIWVFSYLSCVAAFVVYKLWARRARRTAAEQRRKLALSIKGRPT